MDWRCLKPSILAEAVDLCAQEGAEIIAGGTDVMVRLRKRLLKPSLLVDLWGLQGLGAIQLTDSGSIRVGALVTHACAERDPLLYHQARPLALACSQVGSPQVRNMGTIGGNIVNASPAGDTLPALLVLGAELVLHGPEGERRISAESFFTGPGRTRRERGEILTAVQIPSCAGGIGFFVKAGARKALAISKVSVAGMLWLEPLPGGMGVRMARLAMGAVAPVPMRAFSAEEYLGGRELCLQTAAEAAYRAACECRPIDDLRAPAWYRRHLVEVLFRRALLDCLPGGERRGV